MLFICIVNINEQKFLFQLLTYLFLIVKDIMQRQKDIKGHKALSSFPSAHAYVHCTYVIGQRWNYCCMHRSRDTTTASSGSLKGTNLILVSLRWRNKKKTRFFATGIWRNCDWGLSALQKWTTHETNGPERIEETGELWFRVWDECMIDGFYFCLGRRSSPELIKRNIFSVKQYVY